ncbi:MAG: hypothetical protein V3W31_04975, partial [Thermodesulfobacteriota bacterium]
MKVKRAIPYIALAFVAVLAVSSYLGRDYALGWLKAAGHMEYTLEEAQELAYTKCTQCHSAENITKYCFRCGPPFIVVVHNMKRLIAVEKAGGKKALEGLTDAQAVTIAQVWNALVGNWEDTWRKQDIVKLLDGDQALIDLADVPISERSIETRLSEKTAPGVYKREDGPVAPSPLPTAPTAPTPP